MGQLLDAMDLGQYKDTFARECVTGELLMDCDDSILRDELGIFPRLHRLRLKKVIDGSHSAVSIIQGSDPYISM